jgi:hypothetical protein
MSARISSGFEHPPQPGLATGLVTTARPEDVHAVAAQRRDVAAGRRVFPHLAVHRRCDQQGAVARQRQRAQQVVGEAIRQLGQEIGRRRGDQQHIGFPRQIDVRHVVGHTRIPLVAEHRLPESAWKVTGVTKCVAASVITTCTEAPSLEQQAKQFGRLVGRNAARDSEDDAFSSEFHALLSSSAWLDGLAAHSTGLRDGEEQPTGQ